MKPIPDRRGWTWLIVIVLVAAAALGAAKVLRRPPQGRQVRGWIPTQADVAAVFAKMPAPTTPGEKKIHELLKELQNPDSSKERFLETAEEVLALEEKEHGHSAAEPMNRQMHFMLAHSYTGEKQYRKAIPHWEALLENPRDPVDSFQFAWMLSTMHMALEEWSKARPHAEAVLTIARAAKMSEENLTQFERDLDKIKAMEKKPAKAGA